VLTARHITRPRGRGHVDPDILWRFCNEHRNKNSSVLKVSLLSKNKKKQFRDLFGHFIMGTQT